MDRGLGQGRELSAGEKNAVSILGYI